MSQGEVEHETVADDTLCPLCRAEKGKAPVCPHCGYREDWDLTAASHLELLHSDEPLYPEAPLIGRFRCLKRIGRGGMGEVYLVYDPVCKRYVALKRIRGELAGREVLYRRFFREAHLTAQLTHPGVIAIFSIHAEKESLYYTMPYVEGRTLKEILRQARLEEREGEPHPLASGTSIPSLMRVFMSLAQVIAYAHSRGILHRDLKPENIMVGSFGEVYLLDWGLAKWVKEQGSELEEEEGHPEIPEEADLTIPGKLFGTVAYMAPERALGMNATELSDIYALGVILYQILCLRLPFRRTTLKEFRSQMRREELINPARRAPYRNVPPMLARMARRCLAPNPSDRYASMAELVRDLENYLEGRSEWFQMAELNVLNKEDWEFQENVYLAREVALTGSSEVTEWVSMMISKRSFPGNTKIICRIRLGPQGEGIGFLMSVPEKAERELPNTGYCLWLSGDPKAGSKLFRSSVDVLEASDLSLKREQWYEMRLEKLDNNLHFYLDDELKFSYISHLPLSGTHLGILVRDAELELSPIKVYVGSYSVQVNCLAIPDAFLASKDYAKALSEYRRLAYSFADRDEGREAKFRAGITLLEQAKTGVEPELREVGFNLALEEFEKLHATAGAPLEYLGKALVYQAQGEGEEEVKCFQLAFRKYRHHPLLPVLQEQVIYRMHESSRKDRMAAYRFVLLVAELLPTAWGLKATRRLIENLERHWEPLSFILSPSEPKEEEEVHRAETRVALAFWLAKPHTLAEIIEEMQEKNIEPICASNALFALIELGASPLAEKIFEERLTAGLRHELRALKPLLACDRESLATGIHLFTTLDSNDLQTRCACALMERALKERETEMVHSLAIWLKEQRKLNPEELLRIDAYQIWAYLLEGNSGYAIRLFEAYPLEEINMETSMLHFLYGCTLAATEGEEIAKIHLAGVLEAPYPRSWALLGHYLTDRTPQTDAWMAHAFLWERRQLYKQLALYYHCLGDAARTTHYAILETLQYIKVAE